MINFNGTIVEGKDVLSQNRGFKYGDAVFETIKYIPGKILFLEEHYFRLMASMRIIRMEIPMKFTMEFFEAEVEQLIKHSFLYDKSVRIRITVYREGSGLYAPDVNTIGYLIEVKKLNSLIYETSKVSCEVDLFKDHYIAPQLLSTLKTNNRVLNVIAGIYAKENDLDNCLLLNTNKNVVEAINGNVFVVKGNQIKTAPLSDGCIKGVMRNQIIELIKKSDEYVLDETSISPFELQKADEIFITNVIKGLTSVTKYRKKEFVSSITDKLRNKINIKIRLG